MGLKYDFPKIKKRQIETRNISAFDKYRIGCRFFVFFLKKWFTNFTL